MVEKRDWKFYASIAGAVVVGAAVIYSIFGSSDEEEQTPTPRDDGKIEEGLK